MTPVELTRGDGPIVLGIPHTGTFIPKEISCNLNDSGHARTDTDWHIHDLYADLLPGATTVRATFHRYVIDANRDSEGVSLYPGQNTTGLVPLTDFDGKVIWEMPPDVADTTARRKTFHAPYHAALQSEIDRVRARHGIAILYDCHSIRSEIPFLFDGTLPDFNIGDNGGATCAPAITRRVSEICEAAEGFTTVTNGRFKGGWTTRHYGRPAANVHAIQMELSQARYLTKQAPPWTYDPHSADRLRGILRNILKSLDTLARAGKLT